MNKVILLGNVGNDPEIKTFESGTMKASFPLATSEKWTDKEGNKKEQTEWHNCEVWGKRAEVIEKYVKKGQKLLVEGKIKTEKWEDKDGNNRYTTKINVADFLFAGGGNGSGESTEQPQPTPNANSGRGDDLPF